MWYVPTKACTCMAWLGTPLLYCVILRTPLWCIQYDSVQCLYMYTTRAEANKVFLFTLYECGRVSLWRKFPKTYIPVTWIATTTKMTCSLFNLLSGWYIGLKFLNGWKISLCQISNRSISQGCTPCHRELLYSMISTLPRRSCWDSNSASNFQYYIQSGSRIPAVVMEVAIPAKLSILPSFYEMGPWCYRSSGNKNGPYFGKRKQVTKVMFLVKEPNVSVISTDVSGIYWCLT